MERTTREDSGGVSVSVRINKPSGRIGFEKRFFPGVQVGRYGWLCSFASDYASIHTGSQGILYAPCEVNQYYPRLGIENLLMEIFRIKGKDSEIWLTTITTAYPCKLRVCKIKYKISAYRGRMFYEFYQGLLSIEDKMEEPLIFTEVKTLINPKEFYRLIH